MNSFEPAMLALGRSLAVATLASTTAVILRPGLSRKATGLVGLASLTFLLPGMLAGFSGASLVRSWGIGSWKAEIVYLLFMSLRLLPLAFLVITFAPRAMSREAEFCLRINHSSAGKHYGKLHRFGTGGLLAFALVALAMFQEFDIATSWGIRSWSVAIFDAHAGGLLLSETFRLLVWPGAMQIIGLLALWKLLGNTHANAREHQCIDSSKFKIAAGLLTTCFGTTVLIPLAMLLTKAHAGFHVLIEQLAISTEIFNSLALATVATLTAIVVSRRWIKYPGIFLMLIPGLLGPFLIALFLLVTFELPGMHYLALTPLPILVALVLQLAPLAIGLLLVQRSGENEIALFTAKLSNARHVTWKLGAKPQLVAGLILFGCAYGDFTMNAILAPPQFTGAFNRIFNLMHYGQSEVLSAMLCTTLLAPALLGLLAYWLLRWPLKSHVPTQ